MLQCLHEFGSVFDVFTIQTCKADGAIVGHLPREISRATKFLLDRRAKTAAKLITANNRSPLVQGGLENPCKVFFILSGTVRNHFPVDRYLEVIKTNYTEPKNEIIIGSFLVHQLLARQNHHESGHNRQR